VAFLCGKRLELVSGQLLKGYVADFVAETYVRSAELQSASIPSHLFYVEFFGRMR
jgi:hypothetical protein